MSLGVKAGQGFLWTALERFSQQLLSGITFIILARLLTPDVFGLAGMLMIFLALSQSFIDSGMGQALIREKEITDQDRSTVFWLNLFMSILFYILLYLAAPYISYFYGQVELTNLTRVMGLTVIFNGLAIIQRAELTQKLEFKMQAYAQIPAIIIASTVSITMAFLDYGVWALAAQYILVAFCSSLLLWLLAPAKIILSWSKESFRRLFGFGYKLLLSGLLNTTFDHIYKLIIGKYFLAATLGFYTQAQKLQNLASQSMIGVIQKVTYPLLAKTAGDDKRLKQAYRKVIQGSSSLVFPGMMMLIILAEPIMKYVLGEKWLPAAPFLQLLCLSGIFYHLHAINLNVLKVIGRSDLFLKLEIIKKVNITIAIIVGFQFGLYGLLIGQVISSYIALIINTYYTSRFLSYSIIEQFKDVAKVLLLSFPMAFSVYTTMLFYQLDSFLELLGLSIISGLIYMTTVFYSGTETSKLLVGLTSPIIPKKIKKH